MSRRTVQHEYEWKILFGCLELAKRLLGGTGPFCGFTALIDANGNVILFQSNALNEPIRKELKENYGILYLDPIDVPVDAHISWARCSEEMLEKSLNISLDSSASEFSESGNVWF